MSFNKKFFTTGGIVASSEAVCNTDSKYAFGADSSFTSNVATYQLDGDGGVTNNVPDTTTNYNGTATNVTYTTGQFGNAAVFNGTSSVISTSLDIPHTSDFSVSFWVKIDTFANDVICTDGNFDSASVLGFGFQAGTGSNIIFYVASGSNLFNTQVSSLSTGTWYHVVGVCDLTKNIKLYLNGNLEQTTGYTSQSRNDKNNFRIGADYSTASQVGRFFPGEIDQVRVFDRPITASEVATLYAETTSTASSINPLNEGQGVALYNLDYDASDAGGLYDGTPTDVTFGVGGQINYGARFNGSTSDIIINNPPNFIQSGQVGISMWVNIADISARKMIIAKYGSGNNREWRINLYDGTLYAILHYDGNNSNSIAVTAASYLTNNTWHHLAYSVNGTSAPVLYIDGVSVGTAQHQSGDQVGYPTSSEVTSPDPIRIGETISSSFTNFEGDIDQVRFFTSALTSDQVSTLYEEEACVYTATTTDNYFPLADGSSDAVAYYKLDNSAEDSVSTNDGTETNIEYRFGRYGQAAVFNGTNSVLDTNFTISGTADYSCSLWVNMTDDGTRGTLISLYTGTGNSSTILYAPLATASKPDEWYFNSKNSNAFYGPPIKFGQWQHVVLTYEHSSTTFTIYIDGASIGTSVASSATNQNLLIGAQNTAGLNSIPGLIDQVRVFSSVLDSDQVSQLYNEKPETDTSNFKTVLYEGTGATQFISNVGMDLETNGGLVWLKGRDSGRNHRLFDSVRGATKGLYSDLSNAEFTESGVDSFEDNGFFLGSAAGVNANNESFVGWVWKGGGEASNIAVNSITGSTPSIASDVSANTEAGFSIVRHTGTSTVGTIAHGLNQAPEFIMTKSSSHDTGDGFTVYADGLAQSDSYLNMASPNIPNPNSVVWTTSAPNTDTFNVGTATGTNSSGKTYISYCWHSVSGYSKIGTYSGGQSSTDIIPADFEPSWVMIKNITNAHDWCIFDNRRDAGGGYMLEANDNAIESQHSDRQITFVSTGFKINATTSQAVNLASNTYLYMAFK